jgi:hypothetical protein
MATVDHPQVNFNPNSGKWRQKNETQDGHAYHVCKNALLQGRVPWIPGIQTALVIGKTGYLLSTFGVDLGVLAIRQMTKPAKPANARFSTLAVGQFGATSGNRTGWFERP